VLKRCTYPAVTAGRVVFLSGRSQVLIVLEGDEGALSEYLVRHRTQAVDVDSRGRKVGCTCCCLSELA
jgi:hypothetical protein